MICNPAVMFVSYQFILISFFELDVHKSVHRETIIEVTKKTQLYRLIYYSKSVLHVSGDVSQFQLSQATSRQQFGWILPDTVILMMGETSPETCKTDLE